MGGLDLTLLAEHLALGPDGIWVSHAHSAISYPEEGNLNCLALEEGSFWFEHRNRCIQALVRRFTPPGAVFDIGGGNGYVALGLQRAGLDVVLVEPGREGVQNARRRGVTNLVWSTLEDAGFRPACLPAASAFDVIEHIEDDEGFLRQIYHHLVPGGRLYLTVPAFQALWSADDDYAGHYRRYTRRSLERVLRAAGFAIDYAGYIFSLLPAPILLFRGLPSRLGWRRQDDWQAYNQEHARRGGTAGLLLNQLFTWELAQVQAGRALPLGGSCLVAARRPN